jgi:hypothetical protein
VFELLVTDTTTSSVVTSKNVHEKAPHYQNKTEGKTRRGVWDEFVHWNPSFTIGTIGREHPRREQSPPGTAGAAGRHLDAGHRRLFIVFTGGGAWDWSLACASYADQAVI